MYGRKVKLRFLFISLILLILSLSTFLIINSLEENVVYFQSPSKVKNLPEIEKKKIRIGGMVKKDSILIKENNMKFVVTDFKNEILVNYRGIKPNLFEEGQGAVVEGKLNTRTNFAATKILAKHDENYMPKEVADALKKTGNWKKNYGK